ncbi:MAG: GDP-mannose 4,6-dehydratase [Endomicrobiales bacterium]|nr:GDP-mannose 4,6-dehydratase [Endomicrobiales bacterium]
MKVLITGITGFVGSHLADFLLTKKGVEVWGIERWRSNTENIKHIKEKLKIIECDLRDTTSVENTILDIRPDKIFHLAAQSFVPTSWHAPAETLTTNIIGELNVFEAVRKAKINPVIQIAGSSEEYGMVYPNEVPIKETNPLRPLSPYGVSKVGQDMLAYQYSKSYGIKAIRTRGFNHTGPRRGEVFVESNFAQQIAKIEAGKQNPVIHVGNLEAKRDYTDVRDMVRAYWLATEKCNPGEEYNICSGKDWKIQEVLDILLGYSKIKVEVKPDPSRMRPSDVMVLLGDNTKFRNATGWKPEIEFKQTMKDLLDYWRENV